MRTVHGLRSRWHARSLRFQLAAIIALVGLLLIALNAALLGVFLNRYVVDRDGTTLGRQAAALSRCSSDGVLVELFAGQRVADSTLQAVLGSTQDHHAIVVSSSGLVRYLTPMASTLRFTLLARLRRDLAQRQLTEIGTPPWHEMSNEIVVDVAFTVK